MATYVVTPDDYAGWNPTGRNFALAGAGVGAIGLLSWLSLHGHLGSLHPTAAADQLFLDGLVWLGAGGFALMLFVALGSISLSRKSRGTFAVTAEGVTRTLNNRTWSLAWPEIEGFVPMGSGGVTLVPSVDKSSIYVPRFLDDYRACIAELKDHGLHSLPPNSLRKTRRKQGWLQLLKIWILVFLYLSALSPHYPHWVRIGMLCTSFTLLSMETLKDARRGGERFSPWSAAILGCGLLLWALWKMAHTW